MRRSIPDHRSGLVPAANRSPPREGSSRRSNLAAVPPLGRMCYLTTVMGSFHGRVLAARLGAEGVIVVLRGTPDGLYPIQSTVDVLVPADQLELAREILLADAVEDVFGNTDLADLGEPDAVEASPGGQGWGPFDMTTPTGGPSDSFSLRPGPAGAPGRERSRWSGLRAALVIVVVTVMIVVGCVAAVH